MPRSRPGSRYVNPENSKNYIEIAYFPRNEVYEIRYFENGTGYRPKASFTYRTKDGPWVVKNALQNGWVEKV